MSKSVKFPIRHYSRRDTARGVKRTCITYRFRYEPETGYLYRTDTGTDALIGHRILSRSEAETYADEWLNRLGL